MTTKRKDKFIFVIGLLSLIKVRYLGTFALAEIIAFVFLPLIPWKKFSENQDMRRLLKYSLVWLAGVIIADLYNGSTITNSLKGSFNVIFLILLIPFIYWILYDNPQRILYFYAGHAVSSLLSFYIFESYDDVFLYEVWRTYAWYPVFTFVAVYLYFWGKKKYSYCVIELFAIWSLFYHSRNIFLTVSIANVLLIYCSRIQKYNYEENLLNYRRKIPALLVVLLIGGFVVDYSYEYAAKNGYLGENAYQKYIMQKYSEIGLASGRADFLQSLDAIKNNPIFGYGSYALDESGFRDKWRQEHGIDPLNNEKVEIMPGHSYLLGAWVYSGLLGAIFWFFIISIIFKSLRYGYVIKDSRLLGVVLFMLIQMIWNILFSPFANRMPFLMLIVLLILLNTNNIQYKFIYDKNFNYRPLI